MNEQIGILWLTQEDNDNFDPLHPKWQSAIRWYNTAEQVPTVDLPFYADKVKYMFTRMVSAPVLVRK